MNCLKWRKAVLRWQSTSYDFAVISIRVGVIPRITLAYFDVLCFGPKDLPGPSGGAARIHPLQQISCTVLRSPFLPNSYIGPFICTIKILPEMTTRYRVEYALKTHRRDQLIEWIKGLLAVPFVLHSQPTAAYDNRKDVLVKMASTAHKRYAEILHDVCF